MARLYIVSTPIGNLADITYRAVEVLGTVDRVLAEDTRRTSILLRHYGISKPMVSLHAHNEAARTALVLEWLDRGEELAVVSDAGTPLLSDPGARIVHSVVEAGHDVVPVPGASAFLAALVASGLDPEPVTFYGFTPRRGRERTERLEAIAALGHTAVLYESPGRLAGLLRDLEALCGADRRVVVARELTKVHETFYRGTLADAVAYYGQREVRGEVVVLVEGRVESIGGEAAMDEARALARDLLASGGRPSAAARELARRTGLSRNQAYEIVLSLEREDGGEPN